MYLVGGDLAMKERLGSLGVVTNGVDAVWHRLHVKEVVVQEAVFRTVRGINPDRLLTDSVLNSANSLVVCIKTGTNYFADTSLKY